MTKNRILWLDHLRTFAIYMMVVFHFSYDLSLFGIIKINFDQGFWYYWPRVIAGTFLFCVGLSIELFSKTTPWYQNSRTLIIGVMALLVSVGSYFYSPSHWIYFGTLHCIFISIVLGNYLRGRQRWQMLLLALILMGQYFLGFDIKWLSRVLNRPSLDFIPIYPWFWVVLLGMILGPWLNRKLKGRGFNSSWMIKPSHHSLGIYMVHQPLLLLIAWSIKYFLFNS